MSASISTPVLAEIRAVAVMTMRSRLSGISKLTSAWVIGSGWQSGIRSAVFFAAIMPASRAVASTLPLAAWPLSIASSVALAKQISPRAIASRSCTGLAETLTICALPSSSMWVRSLIDWLSQVFSPAANYVNHPLADQLNRLGVFRDEIRRGT